MKLIDGDALMEAINTWPKFGVDERDRIVPWREGYVPYIHLRDVVIAITGMPTIEPEQKVEGLLPDGTLHLFTDTDLSKVKRVLASQSGTHYGDLYYADGDRKTGKWIEQDDGWDGVYYECSVCKEAFTLIDGNPSDNLYNFCPNCGADMRGNEDE